MHNDIERYNFWHLEMDAHVLETKEINSLGGIFNELSDHIISITRASVSDEESNIKVVKLKRTEE